MDRSNLFEEQDNNSINDFINEIRYYLFFWPWFLVSLVVSLSCVTIFLRYSDDIYLANSKLQVKDSNSSSANLIQYSKPVLDFGNVKLENYISQIVSRSNLSSVADILDLQTSIFVIGRVKNNLIFGNSIPFKLEFSEDAKPQSMRLIFNNGKRTILVGEDQYDLETNVPFETKDFTLTIKDNPINSSEFLIKRITKKNILFEINNNLSVKKSKNGDDILLEFTGKNKLRNEAILNVLLEVVKKREISENQELFSLTIDFINDRLISIKNNIDTINFNSTSFKSKNLFFSPEGQSSSALVTVNAMEQEEYNLTTQLDLAESLQKKLNNQKDFSLLPTNLGINSVNIDGLINNYNTLVLERNNLLYDVTNQNPLVVQISNQLVMLKQNILNSIIVLKSNIQTSLAKSSEFKSEKSDELSKISNLETEFLDLRQKFQVAENLYLFLLQRREEAYISFESALPNTRVINYASSKELPISPKKSIIFLGSVLIALLMPFGVIYILKLIDTKIHTRDDLEKLIPNLDILGEVPFVEDIKTVDKSRGVFAESSRVIRSNISFKLPESENGSVILSTSSIKGEGKTMTAFNTAASYVASGKKVLLIGADLRNPQIHNLLNIERKSSKKGLSNLLSNPSIEFSSDYVMSSVLFNKEIDILLSGPIPPNPAELLGSDAFSSLLANLRELYDYIVIDSAPLVLVSDTIPMLKHADLVLYTVRANHTDKKLAPFFNSLVNDKKVNNIGVVLNGIKGGANSYYKYGYGYRYSYQYKYNYGYGYGYGSDKSS